MKIYMVSHDVRSTNHVAIYKIINVHDRNELPSLKIFILYSNSGSITHSYLNVAQYARLGPNRRNRDVFHFHCSLL